MNIVKFPGLNLEFEFSKIAFSVLGVDIYKYAVCIVLGIIVALVLCKLSKEKFEIEYDFVLENFIIGIIFGVIGARAYFVIFNLDFYLKNISEIFNIRDGGLAIYGGLIAGGLSMFINCKIKQKNVLNFFDYIIPFVAIAQSIGRFGNFFNIEAYGYRTTSIFRMGILQVDEYIEVHPVFLYESIITFFIFVILKNIQKKRKFKGEIILLYFIFYSVARAILEGFRTDSLMLFDWRISQVLSVLIFLITFTVFVCRKLSIKKSLKY